MVNKKFDKLLLIFLTIVILSPVGMSINISNFNLQTNRLISDDINYQNDELVNKFEKESKQNYRFNPKIGDNDPFEGYTFFGPEYSRYTYLIDNDKKIVHYWKSDYIDCLGHYLTEDGYLLRMCLIFENPTFLSGGASGRVEKFNNKSNLVWEFEYSTDMYCLHHDIEPLPNGNILMIAWEYKTYEEAISAGRDPDKLDNCLWPDHIIEVKPIGLDDYEIVWEWHLSVR